MVSLQRITYTHRQIFVLGKFIDITHPSILPSVIIKFYLHFEKKTETKRYFNDPSN